MQMISILPILISLNALIIGASCNSTSTKSNHESGDIQFLKCDTLTREFFFTLAKSIKTDMDGHEEMSVLQVIKIVKVYNTLHLSEIANDEKYSKLATEFKETFQKEYLNKIVKTLDCSYGKGMTIYSKKHDLYVGIGTEFRCKDVYVII
jgi:hypothetical protein